MSGGSLPPEDEALWKRVAATVRPIRRAPRPPGGLPKPQPVRPEPVAAAAPPPPKRSGRAVPQPVRPAHPPSQAAPPADTLDGGWDRRIRRGALEPDRTLDLHGHTLATAHRALEQGLADALADGARVLLLVTGRPPRADAAGGKARGLIRGAVPDWIAQSAMASRIAAVRPAHPRHGGAGALYLILRRARGR